MPTSLPALDTTTHVQAVEYACTFGMTQVNNGAVTFMVPQPVQFRFAFDTGRTQPDPSVDLWDVQTDSSWFDQAAQETAIKTALDTICSSIATLIAADPAAIQATVKIARTWRITPNQTGTAAPVQMPAAPMAYVETMAYP